MSALIDKAVRDAERSLQQGDYLHVKQLCADVLRKQPRNRDASRLLGLAHLADGKAADAVRAFENAAKGGTDPEVIEYLGLAHLALGDAARAEAEFTRALRLGRKTPLLYARLAASRGSQGRHQDSEAAYRSALSLAPQQPELMFELGGAIAKQGRYAAAIECYEELLTAYPSHPHARYNVAVLWELIGDGDKARQVYELLISMEPGHADAHNNLGVLYEKARRFEEAVREYETALQYRPQHVAALVNLGKVHRTLGNLEEAEANCRRALDMEASNADALTNLGNVLRERGDFTAALECFQHVLTDDPNNPDVALSAGMLNLAQGDLSAGWALYACRPTRLEARARGVAIDDVLPSDPRGKTVVLLAEQGLGDELFFTRFVPALVTLGARVTYQADTRLHGMLRRTALFETLSAPGEVIPPGDACCLLGDLPRALLVRGGTTSPNEYPRPLALQPLAPKLCELSKTLAALGPPPYVGLTWRAGTPRTLQKGDSPTLCKEVPLEHMAAIMRKVPARYLALQRSPADEELAILRELSGQAVWDLSALNGDLEQMLALLALIDEYVGVSNTNMHLRAAVEKSMHVLVPHPPEWRWMLKGDTSPWFPHATLYRQSRSGSWQEAIGRLIQDLSLAPQ